MAFEDLLVALRDDHLSKLWCEEPLQPPDPAQLLNLLGNPRFKTAVEVCHFFGALPKLAEKPSVLDRDHRLVGERAHQLDLPVGKGLDAMPGDRKGPDNLALTEEWHAQRGAHPPETDRRRRCVFGI